jgi:hypothetical protein
MKTQSILALSLGLLVGAAWAQAPAQAAERNPATSDISRSNAQINRHCIGIVQAKFNYAQLPADARASMDRTHAPEIERCYQSFKVNATSSRVF